MQKLSTKTVKSLLMTFLCLLFVGAHAHARQGAASLEDDLVLEAGKTYEYQSFEAVRAVYTATQNGILTIEGTNPYLFAISQVKERYVDMNTETIKTSTSGVLEVEVMTGEVYYFYSFNFDPGSFNVSFRTSDEINLVCKSVLPEEGSVLSFADASLITFSFNNAVLIDNATLSCGAQSEEVDVEITSQTYASLSASVTLNEWLKAGKIQEGDDFVVTLHNVRYAQDESIRYGTDGTLTVTYKVAAKALELVSLQGASLTEYTDILSYYTVSDPAGKIVLTFDGPIASEGEYAPAASLSSGDIERGPFYYEPLPVSVEGNSVIVNLTDSLRRKANMFPGETSVADFPIAIKVSNMRSTDGQYVVSNQKGATGSMTFMFNLVDISKTVASDFTPSANSSLTGVEALEIWIQNENVLIYDGVRFDYLSDGKQMTAYVMNDKITKVQDAADPTAAILTVPVPKMVADQDSEVTVSLSGLEAADGLDHSNDVVATFIAPVVSEEGGFEILTSSIEDGASIEKIARGENLVITTSADDEIGYLMYEIWDLTADEVSKTMGSMKKGDNGWTSTFYLDWEFMKDHEYEVRFIAYETEDDYNYGAAPYGKTTITWYGLTESYVYSEATMVSITPEPAPANDYNFDAPVNIETAADYNIDITFSEPVTVEAKLVEAFGQTYPLKSLTSNEAGTVWTAVIGSDYIARAGETIQLSVAAKDSEGKALKGTLGEDAGSYWMFNYSNTANVPNLEISVVETAGVVTGLMFENSMTLGQSYINKEIKVYNLTTRTEVCTIGSGADFQGVIPEEEKDNMFYVPKALIYSFDSLLPDGVYSVVVPRGFFIFGEQFNSYNCKETTFTFTVGDGEGESSLDKTFVPVSITPSEDTPVNSIKEIRLKMPATFSLNEADPKEVSLVGRLTGTTITGTIDRDPEDEFATILITLSEEVTEPDAYMLIIPEEAFGDDEYGATEFTGGKCNPKLMYTIGVVEPAKPAEVTPADGSEVTELSMFLFKNMEILDYNKEIVLKDENGEELARFNGGMMDWEFEDGNFDNFLGYSYTLESTITAAGTYTLEIPEGLFADTNFEALPAMTLTYTIGTATGIQNVESDAQVTVYTLNGIMLYQNADASVVKSLKKGMYIINGKKVAVQ